uniref:HDC17592 n=1 Tax=Drosophila melanogaster TaxID=7227 RepID=Q6IIM6_DROME|nr:TPA_inf: HDC17592 [Drosophila melanogaster]
MDDCGCPNWGRYASDSIMVCSISVLVSRLCLASSLCLWMLDTSWWSLKSKVWSLETTANMICFQLNLHMRPNIWTTDQGRLCQHKLPGTKFEIRTASGFVSNSLGNQEADKLGPSKIHQFLLTTVLLHRKAKHLTGLHKHNRYLDLIPYDYCVKKHNIFQS